MKKTVLFAVMVITIVMALTGCGAHKHTWVEATCTTPKTCSECGEVEGEALRHTCSLGVCDRCGEAQGSEVITSVEKCLDKAMLDASDALDYLDDNQSWVTTYDEMYSLFKKSSDYYALAKDDFQDASDICAEHNELADAKAKIDAIIKTIPASPSGSSSNALSSWLDNVEDCTATSENVQVIKKDLDAVIGK